MLQKPKRHTVDVLFVITLFTVFAISVIVLTGIGARVYQSVVDSMSENYNSRTSFSYVYNKIHQYDHGNNVSIGTYAGQDALILSEEVNNISFSTYLYYYDGQLKEIFTRTGQEFDPEFGTDILSVAGFTLSQVTDTLLKCEITPEGGETEVLFLHLRSTDQD